MSIWTGVSEGASENLTAERGFMNELTNQNETMFANAKQYGNLVESAWAPVLSQGAYQYGFSSAEDQNLINGIVNQGAQATAQSINAAELREQQQTGGAGGAPTGAAEALEAQVRATGAQATAARLGQEKELGYEVGRENFKEATSAVGDIAKLDASMGSSAGGQAVEQAKNVNEAQKMVDTESANGLTAKLLGGAIAGGLAFATGGLSGLASGTGFMAGGGAGLSTLLGGGGK